jgi:hypothetical protein
MDGADGRLAGAASEDFYGMSEPGTMMIFATLGSRCVI